MNIIVTILLLPFSILYGLILHIRNKFFDWKIFKSKKFNFPVISVGNLNIGGVGKTPHIEYLINLLSTQYNIATLSRGYKRKTSGFILANNNSSVEEIGDEPLQYKSKFNNIIVAVDEKRVNGIERIIEFHPETNILLLDDAYQHRSVKPGINILITDYSNLYINDYVLPAGRLREMASGSKRADIIIVSKTSKDLTASEKIEIKQNLNPELNQKIYFTYVEYGNIKPFTKKSKQLLSSINNNFSILLFSGIANPTPLFQRLNNDYNLVEHLKFSDHHNFNETDIKTIKDRFDSMNGNNKIIITTEKDIMRLSLPKILNKIQDIPIFYIPIEVNFHGRDKEGFDTQILEYVRTNSRN